MPASTTRRISADDRPLPIGPPPAGTKPTSGESSVPQWAESLGSKLVDQMASLWRDGRGPSAEELLAEHRQLCDHPEVAVRLIYEEICQREQAGDEVDTLEVISRFPQWQGELEVLMDCHRLMQSSPKRPKFPKHGEQLGQFRLLSELDRGAAGRVFLATQPALSDRPVVVKLTPCAGGEHLSLARLQHTHIVPLYLVQDFPERNLRALCMPYVGGLSLARILSSIKSTPPAERTGKDLARVLEQCSARCSAPAPPSGPALEFLARAGYVEAVCWIGACLADALEYAHQRGLMHLDVKPSNVLLAGDGQPMLLDFHLAREPIDPQGSKIAWLGGTIGYMSPEQQRVLSAIGDGQPAAAAIDGRADIYSLGMLLYEMLGGEVPKQGAQELPRLEQCYARISRGVADIVHKCLEPDPQRRYDSAASLANDLRRHLASLPLREVANRSLAERWQKWRRRQPQTVALLSMLVVVLVTLAVMARSHVTQRLREADAALGHGRQQLKDQAYKSAEESFARGLAAVEGLPLAGQRAAELQRHLHNARRLLAASSLDRLVEQLRFVDVTDPAPSSKVRKLVHGCAAVWQKRQYLLHDETLWPDDEANQKIRDDLIDLIVLWSRLEKRLEPRTDQGAAAALAEAQTLFGPHPVLMLARPDSAAPLSVAPRSTWEHVAVGRSLMSTGQLSEAAERFKQAVDLEPQAFWPNFYQAVCAYRLKRYDEALNGFSICVALAPQRVECFHNRALCCAALGNDERAIQDDSRALELDPLFSAAALHRAAMYCRQRQFDEAEGDLRHAEKNGADAARLHYTWALVHLGREKPVLALASLEQALASQPNHAEARSLRDRLQRSPSLR